MTNRLDAIVIATRQRGPVCPSGRGNLIGNEGIASVAGTTAIHLIAFCMLDSIPRDNDIEIDIIEYCFRIFRGFQAKWLGIVGYHVDELIGILLYLGEIAAE